MKRNYRSPELTVRMLLATDVITASYATKGEYADGAWNDFNFTRGQE